VSNLEGVAYLAGVTEGVTEGVKDGIAEGVKEGVKKEGVKEGVADVAGPQMAPTHRSEMAPGPTTRGGQPRTRSARTPAPPSTQAQ